ncbi:hypothetical protein LJY25_07520 [Hymenobacter sp. BT175]|uniref:hypothetical protein n=1 Tax=Hymenobacter translucens TaxID=2886507 RepID=UPI001D0E3A80|nr:hypothetical protein [Hymenobacter translucens]MCC2546290.1 hypothetical protein [Hymenobacter translucens]
MTRASLLHILDHVDAISEGEVRELEQLATAFPYCQTAHVLLAKAAHDRGSMLASQRLRRAATYAADRQLLRTLIETPGVMLLPAAPVPAESKPVEPQAPAAPLPAQTPVPLAPELPPVTTPEEQEIQEVPPITGEPDETVPDEGELPDARLVTEPAVEIHEPEAPAIATTEPDLSVTTDYPDADSDIKSKVEIEPLISAVTSDDSVVELDEQLKESNEHEPEVEPAAETTVPVDETQPKPELPAESALQPDAAQEPDAAESVVAEPEVKDTGETSTSEDDSFAILPLPAPVAAPVVDELPAVAPPIRPPVERGTSRFEYGLGSNARPVSPVYELPELAEAPPAVVFPPFQADSEVGYGLDGGSRFGASLQLHSELSRNLPGEDTFGPDALLLAHAEAHRPPPPPVPTSIELINRFLRSKPRLKAPSALPPADEQADLSVRSTQVVPDLASESLAKILIRQGKIAKAIEIYERLIVRQPEKKAYFVAQIQQLQTSE